MSKFNLTFDVLREANEARLPLFKNARGEAAHSRPDGSDWSPADWMLAVLGEAGEAANLMKKVKRGDFGVDQLVETKDGFRTPRQLIAKEFADVVTYLDLLALQYGIDLGDAVAEKFNEVSDRVGVPVHIDEPNLYAMDDGINASVRHR